MQHFIEVCKFCKDIISQCRCPSEDKVRTFGVCRKCARKVENAKDELIRKSNDALR